MTPAPDSAVARNLSRGKSAWADGVHLLWSAWIFITPLFSGGYSARWLWLTLVSYPLFLALYATALLAPRSKAWRPALGMVALCLLLLRWYPSGLSYFVFGCVLLGTARRPALPRYLLEVLLLNGVLALVALRIGYPWQALLWMLPTSLIVGIIVQVESAGSDKDLALQLSHEEVRKLAATAERERIGRDLHDLLGHTLSLITLKLELARKLSERDPAASRREMEEAERIARDALAEVRSAVTGFRAADLAAELASARLLLESSQVHLSYDPPPSLPADTERPLALVLREATTNIARHARATRARIAFAREAGAFLLQIEDDGRGGIGEDGNGMRGMRERVAALGGTLSVESPKGQGTRILVQVPCRWPVAMAPEAGMEPASPAAARP